MKGLRLPPENTYTVLILMTGSNQMPMKFLLNILITMLMQLDLHTHLIMKLQEKKNI